MDLSFFPIKIGRALENCDINFVYEIRLRIDFPIIINFNNKKCFLSEKGNSNFSIDAIKCCKEDINEIILNITDRSLYAFNDRIKEGYLTTKDGIRIGLGGECVFNNSSIVTIKNFTSLNIRIPHFINDCGIKIYNKLLNNELQNCLIISTPGKGKTTILKDLALKINKYYNKSILIIDERGELNCCKGKNIDIISFCDKKYAFEYSIRSMSPDIVVMDELSSENDWKCANEVINSGVKIIATCHGGKIEQVINKEYFINNIFDKYILLSSEQKAGTIKKIYNGDLTEF